MTLEQKILLLPPDKRAEVADFVDFLLTRAPDGAGASAVASLDRLFAGRLPAIAGAPDPADLIRQDRDR